MKAMIIGLGPEYNYPGSFSKWSKENTRYASNHGASLISRTLAKQFNADYVDDFSDVKALKKKYDLCIVAFATHITCWRDVAIYADAIEKLDMKTVAFSLGVQDYSGNLGEVTSLHPSIKRLLRQVSERSSLLGVRGHYTASILYKHGFKNAVPIGCPTLFWGLRSNLQIKKPESYKRPLVAYHRTLSCKNLDIIKNVPLLGQDFLDEAVFTNNLEHDTKLKKCELKEYEKQGDIDNVMKVINNNGVFYKKFADWFDFIKKHDFVFGARLHGCIAALVQGIPAVLITRDLRTAEIAELFNIPCVSYENLISKTIDELYDSADYTEFNKTYKLRYKNYLSLLEENKLSHNLEPVDAATEFVYSAYDVRTSLQILHADSHNASSHIHQIKGHKVFATTDSLYKFLARYHILRRIFEKINIGIS